MPDEWRSFPEGHLAVWQAVLSIRAEVNQLLEKARADKLVGSSLEAKVRPQGGVPGGPGEAGPGVYP